MISAAAESFQIYGEAKPPPAPDRLRAGPLTMEFETTSGFLRRIRLGDIEVLRGIYAAVRDPNWGTVPPELRLTERHVGDDSFYLAFACVHRRQEIDFFWRGVIDGRADGTVRYTFDGEARTAFRKNRIGFCVLHPVKECSGAMARQFRIDGSERDVRFPGLIEPQIFGRSSFRQLRGIQHQVIDGCEARVDFEGDVFEMEDQRNWTDASFKTYCTPLLDPFPVVMVAGQRIRQAVTLRLLSDDTVGRRQRRPASAVRLPALVVLAEPNATLPELGLGAASHGVELTSEAIGRLRELRLSHLRVDVRVADPRAAADLDRAAREAARLDVPLELALHLPADGDGDVAGLRALLRRDGCRLTRVLALREGEMATTPETLRAVRGLVDGLGVPVGAGSDCNFCELNHEHATGRFGLAAADFVFWSVTPQVHAYDHRSVMETIEAQPATVHTARAFAAGRPLVVSPLTLRQRFNPVATGVEMAPPVGELPATVDPRQLSSFAAAWTFASIAALAEAGVTSATYFETTGWRGVMECPQGSPLPEKFPSDPGVVFPVYHVLAGLAGFRSAAVTTGDGLAAMTLFSEKRPRRLLVGNLIGDRRRVRIEGWGGARRLDLGPYQVARLEAGA
jgi:hypothetical protein